MRSERGQSAKDYWYQANKESEKGKKGKKDKKGERTKDTDKKKKGACNNCKVVVHFALNCRRKRIEPHYASYSGRGDLHHLKNTDGRFPWITMLEKVGFLVEQSNITELLMDSGAASHVWLCRMTAVFFLRGGISERHRYTGYISGYAGSEVPIG